MSYHPDNFVAQEKRSMVGSMNIPNRGHGWPIRGGAFNLQSLMDYSPIYGLAKHLSGNGAEGFDFEHFRQPDGSFNFGLLPPPHNMNGKGASVFGGGYAPPIFGGQGEPLPPGAFEIPLDLLHHQVSMYKRQHGIQGRGLPLDHTLHLMEHGAKHGTRGGLLPFAALLPLIGSALSTLAPAVATGAAGALGSWGFNKLAGNGAIPPIQYHRGRNSYILHGEGWRDVFKSILDKAKGYAKAAWNSKLVQRAVGNAASHGRRALEEGTRDLFRKAGERTGIDFGQDEDTPEAQQEQLDGTGYRRKKSKRRGRGIADPYARPMEYSIEAYNHLLDL